MTPEILAQALTSLEIAEEPLLTWGVTDGAFSEDEALQLLGSAFPELDPDELLDALETARLVRLLDGQRLRTRSAETVRLAASLRQWFHGRDWRTAPSLVSDFRFIATPRGVPDRRAIGGPSLVSSLESIGTDRADRDQALLDILGGRTVSAFQARATQRLLEAVSSGRTTGTVVTAGTGAGKTLSFYLPALAQLLGAKAVGRCPRIVAIYPRTELLRDQLSSLIETLDRLHALRGRAPSVGVLYGASPLSRSHAESFGGWKRQGADLVSPILSCPSCGGPLIWPAQADLLQCEKCGRQLAGDRLAFIRRSMTSSPPDILFTTTEMVNRYLGHQPTRRLLVGDSSGGPEFILLDEIHTYSGTHGAQVANLLRRWRAESAHASTFVGLSATLADPVGFFSELTGLSTGEVALVAPRPEEMVEVGREYMLVLRGDPASQTSLLSTTIQTSMLLRRMLDPDPAGPSSGLFGSKVFAFTDDLDLVNRLHHQLSDAEGWRPDGVNQRPTGSLARLRASGTENRDRDDAGQLWELAQLLGTVNSPVRIGLTTSQASGVDDRADIVVATASLEVGFDDPDVGAVVQHKAPRDAAQFLQRKGRAGRDPTMRPWTVVVLSDYGRDRLAFQGYEALASPVVRPARLPLRNRVLLKIQGAWVLLDMLGRECGASTVQRVVSGNSKSHDEVRRMLRVVDELMTPVGLERLVSHLRRSLSISDDEARSVVWDAPRALATAVLPTLHRALVVAREGEDGTAGRPPLWEFAPSSLFASLLTPEVRLVSARRANPEQDDEFFESVGRALRLFAPGRVSYRYAPRGRGQRVWIAPPDSTDASYNVENFLEASDDIDVPADAGVSRLLSPLTMRLTPPPGAVPDMAYGSLRWRLSTRSAGSPLVLDVPARTQWTSVVDVLEAYSHRFGCPLTITRFATEIVVDRRTTQDPLPTVHTLASNGQDAGIGFSMDVDGLRCVLRVPQFDLTSGASGALVRALRPMWLEHLADVDPDLIELVPSKFQRAWLAQLLTSGIASLAASWNLMLRETVEALTDSELGDQLVKAADEIFGSEPPDDATVNGTQPDRLLADVIRDASDDRVRAWLRRNSPVLWLPVEDLGWRNWVGERFLATVGSAAIQAAQLLCPENDASELRLEVALRPDEASLVGEILILEDEPGGSGLIEALVDRYMDDPRAFWKLVAASLQEGDQERVDAALRAFLVGLKSPELRLAADRVRHATGLATLTQSWHELRSAMFRSGLPTDASVVAAIATRVLRSGSGAKSESLIEDLLTLWDGLESTLGVEMELRVFALIASRRLEIVRQLDALVVSSHRSGNWAYSQIVGLLWSRGARLRSSALQSYNSYTPLPATERLLASQLASPASRRVLLPSEGWRTELDDALAREGTALLCSADAGLLGNALVELVVEPTYLEALETHARVGGVVRSSGGFEVLVELREIIQ
jgi:hypothetical protein